MNRFLGIILLYLFSNFTFCLKLYIIGNKERPHKYSFLRSDGIWGKKNNNNNNNIKKRRKYHRVFYKNQKERDIFESGYLYPFDHLEKKKKKFPPDPYHPSEEEKEEAAVENAIDAFDEELNDVDFLHYEENDAKQYFGKTEFNRPEIIEEDDEEVDKEKEENENGDEYDICNIEEAIGNVEENKRDFVLENGKENGNIDISKERERTDKIERELVKISVHFSEGNEIKAEMIKDQLHYLFHSCMDNTFNEIYNLNIVTCASKIGENYGISVSYSNNQNIAITKRVINSISDLMDFYRKIKNKLNEKIEMLHRNEMESKIYLSKNEKKKLEKSNKEKKILNASKNNLQISIESSLKLIEKCNANMYKQSFELTLQDLKLAYIMLPCKYYGYFLSDLCARISILSFYINDLQSASDFALKAIKYEPKYFLPWKCLGDSYRSFRKFWQAKNAYDIAVYLGYTDTKGENFKEIMKALNDLKKRALENVDMLKENMNNHFHVTVKKNIGIVINKNPDCIGGCYVSYIIEGGKAGKKNFEQGDQIVSLNNIITFGKPIDFCLKAFQKNEGLYDLIFFKGNIIELYGLKAYKYLIENNLFSLLFENEDISSFKKNETILFDMRGFGTFSEYDMTKREV